MASLILFMILFMIYLFLRNKYFNSLTNIKLK
jgi:hypothetical protein